ncbi:MAG: hypothetical protein ACXACO_12810 [Promethearchaeota archaeon]
MRAIRKAIAVSSSGIRRINVSLKLLRLPKAPIGIDTKALIGS